MRVISNYQDFYDRAGFIDQSVIFLRKSEKVPLSIVHPVPYSRVSNVGLLGFCGKLYPYIHRCIEGYTNEITGKVIEDKHFYFYSFEDYKQTKFWDREMQERRYRWGSINRAKDYADFFAHWKDTDTPFIEVDAPYFKVKEFNSDRRNEKGLVITNPSLVNMQFGKIMDAATVFQTVQFYLTNQLVKTKDPDEVDDKYRIAGHGFDKYSFRHPTKLKDLK